VTPQKSDLCAAARVGEVKKLHTAAPMIGGMVSSTILTLLVIPTLYALWRGRDMNR